MSSLLPLRSWPRSSWCARAASSLKPGGPYSNDTVPRLYSHRRSDLRDYGARAERHLGLVWRLRSGLLRLRRVGRLHDARPHHRPADPAGPIYLGVAVAVSGRSPLRRGVLGTYGTHRRPDCTPAPSWNLFLHRYFRSGLRTVCIGRPVCAPVRRLQRPVWPVRPDGGCPWPRLSVLPVLLPWLLRVHLHPRLHLHGASLWQPFWPRATNPSRG